MVVLKVQILPCWVKMVVQEGSEQVSVCRISHDILLLLLHALVNVSTRLSSEAYPSLLLTQSLLLVEYLSL
jgi:hypothetical protein